MLAEWQAYSTIHTWNQSIKPTSYFDICIYVNLRIMCVNTGDFYSSLTVCKYVEHMCEENLKISRMGSDRSAR